MKILLFSDLHLDRPFRRIGPGVGNRWRQALVDTLRDIVALADRLEVDALCSGGDLFEHDLVAPNTPVELQAAFASIDHIPVYLAPGNHDWFGGHSVYAQTAWSPNVEVFTTDSLEPRVLASGFNLWGAAHLKPAGTRGFLDIFQGVANREVNVALFHGSLRSWVDAEEKGKEPHAAFDLEQVEQAGFVHALLGHFHTPRHTEWHTYPGNPEPLGFGETGNRGAVLLEFSPDGTVSHTVHRLARTSVADLTVDVSGCATESDLRLRVGEALAAVEGIVRLRLVGEVDQGVRVEGSLLSDLGGHLDWLEVDPVGVSWSYPLDIIVNEATVRGEFVREVIEADLDEDVRRRVLITGLRALDRRTDLAVE